MCCISVSLTHQINSLNSKFILPFIIYLFSIYEFVVAVCPELLSSQTTRLWHGPMAETTSKFVWTTAKNCLFSRSSLARMICSWFLLVAHSTSDSNSSLESVPTALHFTWNPRLTLVWDSSSCSRSCSLHKPCSANQTVPLFSGSSFRCLVTTNQLFPPFKAHSTMPRVARTPRTVKGLFLVAERKESIRAEMLHVAPRASKATDLLLTLSLPRVINV